jgi:hypothetical protein
MAKKKKKPAPQAQTPYEAIAQAEGGDKPVSDAPSVDMLKKIGEELVVPGAGIKDVLQSGEQVLGIGKGKKAAPKKKKTTTATTAAPTQDQIIAEEEKAVSQDPFYQMGQALLNEDKTIQAPIEAAVSGADTASATQGATTQALADAGLSPNSSAAQWLNSNIAQANANDAPMTAAMNAYGKAYSAGQQGEQTALSGSAQANALGVQAAPETNYLNLLSQHLGYGQGYTIPQAQAQALPTWLQYYMGQAQVQGGPKGGWPGAAGSTAATAAGTPIGAGSLAAAQAAQPSALTPGTTSAPG